MFVNLKHSIVGNWLIEGEKAAKSDDISFVYSEYSVSISSSDSEPENDRQFAELTLENVRQRYPDEDPSQSLK